MYHHNDSTTSLRAIFLGLGAAGIAPGWFLYQKFRDDRPKDAKGFRDFGLGTRGLIAFAGIGLICLGAGFCVLALLLPALLR